MAGKTAILSVRILGDGKPLQRTLNAASRSVQAFNRSVAQTTNVASLSNALKQMSGIRILGDATKNLGSFMSNLDRSLPRIATLSTSIVTLGSMALAGTSNLFALGASLASIAPAALALPGIFAGFGVGIAVTALALKDMGTVLSDLGPQFTNLQTQLSGDFWAKAEAPIRRMVSELFPSFAAGIRATATELGSFTGALATALTGALSGGALATLFDPLIESIRIAKGALEPLVQGLVNLGTVGGQYLPQLAQWFVELSNSFKSWTESADITGMVNAGITAMQGLGGVISNTGGILSGFAAAASAAGGASLGALADGLGRVNAAVNGPVWQGALTTVFAGAHAAMQNLAPGVSALGDAFVALAPTLSTIMQLAGQIASVALEAISSAFQNPAFQGGLVAFFEGVLAGVQGLAPALPSIATAIGAVATFAGTLASVLGPILGQAFIALAPAITTVVGVLTGLIPIIGSIGTFVVQNADAFMSLGVAVLAGMAALRTVSAVMTGLRVVMLGVTAVQLAMTTGMAAYRAGLTMKTAALAAAAAAQRGLNIAMIANPIGIIIALIVALVAGLVWFFTQTNAGKAAWAAFMSFAQSAVAAFGAAWNAFVTFLGQAWNNVVNGIKAIWNAVWNGIRAIVAAVIAGVVATIQRVRATAQAVGNGVKSFFTAAFNAVRSVVQSVISAAINIINRIRSTAQAVGNGVRSFFTAAFNAVRSIIQSVISAAINIINRIRTTASTVGNGVRSFFTSAFNAVRSIIQSVISAAINIINRIRSTVQTVSSAARSLFTAAFNAVRSVIQSVISAAISIINRIRATVSAVTSAARSAFSGAFNAIRGVVNSVISGITGGLNRVRGVIDSVIGGVKNAIGFVGNLLGMGATGFQLSMAGFSLPELAVAGKGGGAGATGLGFDPASLAVGRAGSSSRPSIRTTAPTATTGGDINVNLTVNMSELAELKTIESFVDMVRLKTRKRG